MKYRLTFPTYGNNVYESRSFNKVINKCYNEFKQLSEMEDIKEQMFGVTNIDTGIEYKFKIKNKTNKLYGGTQAPSPLSGTQDPSATAKQEQTSTIAPVITAPTIIPISEQSVTLASEIQPATETRTESALEKIMNELTKLNNRLDRLESNSKSENIKIEIPTDHSIQIDTETGTRETKETKEIKPFVYQNNFPKDMLSDSSSLGMKELDSKNSDSDLGSDSNDIVNANIRRLDAFDNLENKDEKCNIM